MPNCPPERYANLPSHYHTVTQQNRGVRKPIPGEPKAVFLPHPRLAQYPRPVQIKLDGGCWESRALFATSMSCASYKQLSFTKYLPFIAYGGSINYSGWEVLSFYGRKIVAQRDKGLMQSHPSG